MQRPDRRPTVGFFPTAQPFTATRLSGTTASFPRPHRKRSFVQPLYEVRRGSRNRKEHSLEGPPPGGSSPFLAHDLPLPALRAEHDQFARSVLTARLHGADGGGGSGMGRYNEEVPGRK